MATHQYGDMLCQDVDFVGTSSELDNEDDDEDDSEDDNFYDEDDSNLDDDFEGGLSINEEAEIMRYALASSHDLQQYESQTAGDTNSGTNNNSTGSSNCHNIYDSNPNLSIYTSTEKLIMETGLFDTKMRLIGNGVVLLVTTFALLVLLPLYFQQLTTSGPQFNVFGATFLVSSAAALVFLIATIALGVAIKWKVPFYKPPLPWTKLIVISSSYGLSCILFATSCYQRVPCHLQDPLKAAALVFSLIFYFFFCRKVMGLQRIFSATTAVVGLFIAVDYGLCDEFRCRGTDLTDQFFQNSLNPVAGTPMEWRSRAIWAILYIVGIALWSLHVALLESSIVIPTKEKQRFTLKPIGFLRTVSRLVASSETPRKDIAPPDAECEKQEELTQDYNSSSSACPTNGIKSHPLHIIVWVHVMSVVVIAAFGWIDMFPVTGPIKTFSRHLLDTENTLKCHLNLPRSNEDHSAARNLELLTNFVPGSANFNETVQRLRSRRSLVQDSDKSITSSSSRNNNETKPLVHSNVTHHSLELHFNYTTKHHVNKTPGKHLNHNKFPSGSSSPSHHAQTAAESKQSRKSDNSYTWKWFQGIAAPGNKVNQTLLNSLLGSSSSSGDQSPTTNKSGETGNCGRTQIYGVILLGVYLLFAACLINFLIISESAVFTVCVVTGALPLIGVFWSLFEVSFDESDQTVGLIWSPEVSGELICSLLGCPIVFLGIGLLCRANFIAQMVLLRDELVTSKSQCLSYDNRNYYSSYLETGLSNVGEVSDAEIRSRDGQLEKSGCGNPQ